MSIASILTGTPAGLEVPSITVGTINCPASGITINSTLSPEGTAEVSLTNGGSTTATNLCSYTHWVPGATGFGLTEGAYQMYQYSTLALPAPIWSVPFAPLGGYNGREGTTPLFTNIGMLDPERAGTFTTDVAGAATVAVQSINSGSEVLIFPRSGAAFPAGPQVITNTWNAVPPAVVGFTVAGGGATVTYSYIVLG